MRLDFPKFFALLFVTIVLASFARADSPTPQKISTRSGDLLILSKNGAQQIACPLQHTGVQAEISGLFARVRVKQIFRNPLNQSIEAVYVFPLPQSAAIDDMTMTIGARKIKGQIKPREEARQIYEAAKAKGQTASLLDQERPNIFTQSVANIAPNAQVVIEISYVESVKFEDGVYEWSFPMVVGPRYMPGTPTTQSGTGWSPDTTQVPDASKISPPVALPSTRAGHDINLQVRVNAGQGGGSTPLREIESTLHAVNIKQDNGGAMVSLANKNEIPNKDFVLRYKTASDEIGDAFFKHRDARGTFFSLMLQPPSRVTREQTVPRELVFVLDTSGSMSGFPIEKAKSVMSKALDNLGPRDEFNLITFSGDTHVLWPQPQAATPENLKAAQEFLASRQGGGGTEMMQAINAALEGQDKERVRVVCFMTDGYVGNDFQIIDAVKKNAGTARVFSFGIGNSVNRFLLDGMAQAGRGAVEYVTLAGDADAAANRFYQRINAPVLTDVSIDWGGLPVEEIYPKRVLDLFSSTPVFVLGRFKPDAKLPDKATITLRGRNAVGNFERRVRVKLKGGEDNEVLPSLWARQKIGWLMTQDMAGLQSGKFSDELKTEITNLGIEYRLMTQFTSFVAVEEKVVNVGGKNITVAVPVEMPAGVSYEGVFGAQGDRGVKTHFAIGPTFGADTGIGGQVGQSSGGSVSAGVGYDLRRNIGEFGSGPSTPAAKLAAPLRDLAGKVEKAVKPGEYSEGKLRVENYRVAVKIYLRNVKDETRAALQNLGFQKQWENETVVLLIGTIDVRKLDDLSKLESVTRIEPVET